MKLHVVFDQDGSILAAAHLGAAAPVGVRPMPDEKHGEQSAEVDLPKTAPAKTLLRLRLPGNAKLASATAGGKDLNITNGETIDLTGLSGHVSIRTKVGK